MECLAEGRVEIEGTIRFSSPIIEQEDYIELKKALNKRHCNPQAIPNKYDIITIKSLPLIFCPMWQQ